uniref:Ig-like domain-containing protein n=1 Tax=Oryzias latipes TaxID=8090 RepID=A0A3P9KU08_ORYLA
MNDLLKWIFRSWTSRVKCEQLTQPASGSLQPGERLTITCQVSYSLSYYTGWIRQPAGKGLERRSNTTNDFLLYFQY